VAKRTALAFVATALFTGVGLPVYCTATAFAAANQPATVSGSAQQEIDFDNEADFNAFANLCIELAKKANPSADVLKKVERNLHKDTLSAVRPLYGAQVTIGNQTATIGVDGTFSINVTPGTYDAKITWRGSDVYHQTVTIKPGQNKVVLTVANTEQQAISNMSKNMDMGTTAPAINSASSPSGPAFTNYQPGFDISPGIDGHMKILDWQQHVSCNKSDNNDLGAHFPWNNSDCANSIAAGFDYYSDPANLWFYQDGEFCVNEAMNVGDKTGKPNIYCNGQPQIDNYGNPTKPVVSYYHDPYFLNAGFNCSSFPFLNHLETFQPYSNLY
jgi:hypothetical protein